MNNIFSFLLCIIILALAPACKKSSADRQKKVSQKDTKKLIELDNTVFEAEEFDADNDQKSITKF